MRSTTKPLVTNEFRCATCANDLVMTAKEMSDHLKMAHGFIGQVEGRRKMLEHVDGRDFYWPVYEWTFDGAVKVRQKLMASRDKDDPMRFD